MKTIEVQMIGLIGVVALTACHHAGSGAVASNSALALVPYAATGGTHAARPRVCDAPEYHQFDFWLGTWDAYTAQNKLNGTNILESKLGGCVVEENWTGANLGRGRSLNFFDASTKTWSQMWVSSGGCPTGVILIEGTFADGYMTMRGRRQAPDGVVIGPPCGPTPPVTATAYTNLIRWAVLPNGSVMQQPVVAPNDDTLPQVPPPSSGFGLRYDRVATVTPLNSPDPSYCPNRPETPQFDFMLGTWSVRAVNGTDVGTSTFSKDMQGCLVEEHFVASNYEGMSFNTFDPFTKRWLRTYVDTDGERFVLWGGVVGNGMVMTGLKKTRAGASNIRVSWKPDGPNRVTQQWEVANTGGEGWRTVSSLVYGRK